MKDSKKLIASLMENTVPPIQIMRTSAEEKSLPKISDKCAFTSIFIRIEKIPSKIDKSSGSTCTQFMNNVMAVLMKIVHD